MIFSFFYVFACAEPSWTLIDEREPSSKTSEYLYFSEVFPFLSIEPVVMYYAWGSEFWLILVFKFFCRQVSFRKAFLSNESINQVKFLKKKTLGKNE